jgi:conjugative transfer signal peptidase TraF
MSRRGVLTVAAAGVLLMVLSALGRAPTLVWNASDSVPVGLYRLKSAPVRHGDAVLVRPPPAIAELAYRRAYLPNSAYLIKIVMALPGHHVCRFGSYVFVRGVFVVRALPRDRLGRRMPLWHGCRRLAPGELFVLSHNPQSFDSRYFGPVSMGSVVGRADLLWPSHPDATISATR